MHRGGVGHSLTPHGGQRTAIPVRIRFLSRTNQDVGRFKKFFGGFLHQNGKKKKRLSRESLELSREFFFFSREGKESHREGYNSYFPPSRQSPRAPLREVRAPRGPKARGGPDLPKGQPEGQGGRDVAL